MKTLPVFENFAQEYGKWFDTNMFAFESELSALRRFVPKKGNGLEVGVGTRKG